MKKHLFILLLLPLLWVGCEEPEIKNRKPVVRTYEEGNIRISFWLATSEGEVATVFEEGEEIVQYFSIEPISKDTIYIANNILNVDQTVKNFGTIYRQSDNKEMACADFGKALLPEYGCMHVPYPDLDLRELNWWINYPQSYYYSTSKNEKLKKGRYYFNVQPSIAYYEQCACSGEQKKIFLSAPDFKIKFQIK